MARLDKLPLMSLPEEDMLNTFVSEIRSELGATSITELDVSRWVDDRMPCAGWDRKTQVRDCVWTMVACRQELGV